MGCANSTERPDAEMGIVRDFHNDYCLGPKLGQGAYAQVRVAFRRDTDTLHSPDITGGRAVKILKVRHASDAEPSKDRLTAAHTECTLWEAASGHAHCVRLFETFQGSVFCYMVMERCTSSLFRHLENMTELTERTVGGIFAQMLLGLAHVHAAHIVHRDVKPDNFLVGGEDGQTVKLADFGLSARLPKGCKLHDICGTPPYMCPEMLGDQGYDEKADVWSLGVVAYAFFFGTYPYMPKVATPRLMKMAIVSGEPPKYLAVGHHRTEDAIEFVRLLLHRTPDQRPCASEASHVKFIRAVAAECHAPGIELTTLRPMLQSAKKIGAFANSDVPGNSDVDKVPSIPQKHRQETNREQILAFEWAVFAADEAARRNAKRCAKGDVSICSTICNSDVHSNSDGFRKSSLGSAAKSDRCQNTASGSKANSHML